MKSFVKKLLLVLVLGSQLNGFAGAPLFDINPAAYATFNEAHGTGMVGWTFQLLVPFTVTQVGWYDEVASNGLSRAFQVGLWHGTAAEGYPGTPPLKSSSLIGDPTDGVLIPAGTNTQLVGVWRVVDLPKPVTLEPGFYEIGGLDNESTPDVIKYVMWGAPGLTPPGAHLLVGQFFNASPSPLTTTNFGPCTNFYAAWGLELGPMLLGTNAPLPEPGVNIRRFRLNYPSPDGFLLSWAAGSLYEAEAVAGPYSKVFSVASPVIMPAASASKFFRLGP